MPARIVSLRSRFWRSEAPSWVASVLRGALGFWLLLMALPVRADDTGFPAEGSKPHAAAQTASVGEPGFRYDPSTGKPSQVRWQPYWPRMRAWEYAATVTMVGLQLAMELGALPITLEGEPRTRGPWPGDGILRDLLRVADHDSQLALDKASDFTWHLTETFPLYGSILTGALLIHGSPEVAWQLTAMSVQSVFLSGLLSRLAQATVRRQRPHFRALCPAESEETEEFCRVRPGESVSFFSGHAALAFTGAGLTCRFHQELPLFGGGWGDALACTAAMSGAVATGLLRVLSDRHYASDTLFGALVGFFNGYFLPKLLHFHDGPPSRGDSALRIQWLPWLSEGGGGMSAAGRW